MVRYRVGVFNRSKVKMGAEMKRLVLCVVIFLVLVGNAIAGSFQGTITGPNGTKTYGDSSHRKANMNTIAFLDQESCAEVCRMSISPYPGDHQNLIPFMQRLAKNKKAFRVDIDTKVDVIADLGYQFKGRMKDSDTEFWFISDHFFFDGK